MTINLLGPYGAGVLEVLSRPARPTIEGTTDSWFGPCSTPTSRDATKVMHYWLNDILAQVRRAVRGMGITETVGDDDMLLKAIQKADRTIDNVGGLVELYKGLNGSNGHHEFRTLEAGSGIDIVLDGDNVRIINTALSGGGGGLESVGDGIPVLKGLSAGLYDIRSIGVTGGLAIDLDPALNKIVIDGSGIGGGVRIVRRVRYSLGSDVLCTTNTVIWSASYTPVAGGNTLEVRAKVPVQLDGMVGASTQPQTAKLQLKLQFRKVGDTPWTDLDTVQPEILADGYADTGNTDLNLVAVAALENDLTIPTGAPVVDLRLIGTNVSGTATRALTGAKFLACEYAS